MSAAEKPTPYAELASVIDSLPLISREMRRARGLSQRAAAREMNLAPATLLRFERGDDGANVATMTAVMRWIDQQATS
jgi:DNA-binding XRE family transcriptional regulator